MPPTSGPPLRSGARRPVAPALSLPWIRRSPPRARPTPRRAQPWSASPSCGNVFAATTEEGATGVPHGVAEWSGVLIENGLRVEQPLVPRDAPIKVGDRQRHVGDRWELRHVCFLRWGSWCRSLPQLGGSGRGLSPRSVRVL